MSDLRMQGTTALETSAQLTESEARLVYRLGRRARKVSSDKGCPTPGRRERTNSMESKACASEYVNERLALLRPAAHEVTEKFSDHPDVCDLYPALLRMLHGVVRASVPLLELAAGRCDALAEDDNRMGELATYLRAHAEEERDHDVWLLEDYPALGLDPLDVLEAPPSPTVAAMVGAAYYWVLNLHPATLLGYLMVMEGAPPSYDLIDLLERRTCLDPSAFRTLRHHAEADPHHGDESPRCSTAWISTRPSFTRSRSWHCRRWICTPKPSRSC